ncbi:chalcone isomerase family protein [Aquimarina sp. 2201CG5-10]|uniref:chalcone isomerase family protein n=1 Tax=Aquimarina callyspongiae TaxID=3098150 RepID=UPI002AB3EC33|nr:chalcone isomerase family protein [Aquimarina sp. 2201CG5-10]MDY8136379.1 chalcone isomerase family protein [Aquimarina sp. 2201CG5-10]
MKKIITLTVVLLFSLSAVAQVRIGDIVVPDTINFDGEELSFNGGAMRKVLSFKTYSGALYTKQKYSDDRKVLDSDETMAIRLNIASKKVTNERMIKVFRKGFDDAMFGNTQTLDARIDDFLKLFSSPMQLNDFYDLVYLKGKGVKTYKNGKELGFIEGRDFKYALFKIWLGNEPACQIIKGGMLGSKK